MNAPLLPLVARDTDKLFARLSCEINRTLEH